MRLTELEPRWLEHNGERIAIMFKCPHCVSRMIGHRDSPDLWVTCFFRAAGDLPPVPADHPIEALRGSRGERVIFHDALKAIGHHDPVEGAYTDVIDCRANCAWAKTSDDFNTMSITPSIDASASGHWHGFVTNGDIR